MKKFLTLKSLQAKIQNQPPNFQSFSFQLSNFQFFHFSPLTFNFCQCGVSLKLSQLLLLGVLKQRHFGFFFFNFGIKKIRKICKYIQGNCTLPTCGLARFNSAHLWFKSCHLTHLRWPPLDPHYPPLPFPLENPFYYISQNQNPNITLKKRNELSPSLYIRTPNPFPLYQLDLRPWTWNLIMKLPPPSISSTPAASPELLYR